MTLFAHTRGDDKAGWETLDDHSRRVGDAAARLAARFGDEDFAKDCEELARQVGHKHDIGKADPAFQSYLEGKTTGVTHSAEGAKFLADHGGGMGRVLASAIAGHHGRLPDPARRDRMLAAARNIDPPSWCKPSILDAPRRLRELGNEDGKKEFRVQFLTRMIYGALCDADSRETAAFYRENNAPARETLDHDAMIKRVEDFIRGFGSGGKVNAVRRRILDAAMEASGKEPGAFTLTVPTGGGKTITSLMFALMHAKKHDMDRVIYVIPYTSIVEQTADVYREVLGKGAVLEHHANADWRNPNTENGKDDEEEARMYRDAGASWNMPVVITTSVQFFESLFSASKKRCRKLPSLARSVVILDEAQALPLDLLRPCLAALNELMDGYGSSIVLSTATQPSLTRESGFPARSEAIPCAGDREIAPDPDRLFRDLERVKIRDAGALTNADVAARMRDLDQVLAIVDNRAQARELFDAIRAAPGSRHLSTMMTPDHRRAVIAATRRSLGAGEPVRLVSTSLIEAGVDIDFPRVMRSAAGIDSIAQAAGRCNREGRLDAGIVEVFRSDDKGPAAVEQFASIGRVVMQEVGEGKHDSMIGRSAVSSFFRRVHRAHSLDSRPVAGIKGGIINAIEKGGVMGCPFESIEEAFRIIRDDQRPVMIVGGGWGIPERRLDKAKDLSSGSVAAMVQGYSINVPGSMWQKLWDGGHLFWWAEDRHGEHFAALRPGSLHLYDPDAGLSANP